MDILKRKAFFGGLDRVVLKIGTSLLADNGKISMDKFEKLSSDIASLKSYVKDLVVVTSGAIGAGYSSILGSKLPGTIPLKQASASIGQVLIMKYYMDFLSKRGYTVSQILLTGAVLTDRERYVNAKNTINTLLQYGVIPIVNENDTVSVDEIKFGDNDTLAALVASLIDADLLIIFSDVDGFYADFLSPSKRRLLPIVESITPRMEKEAKKEGSNVSRGGMITKLRAAKLTTMQGIPLMIASGTKSSIIDKIFSGSEEGTIFLSSRDAVLKNKKRWIHLNAKVKGKLFVDELAFYALTQKNKSLLPKGIIKTSGNYSNYDTVEILNPDNEVFAKGISNYNHNEVERIMGLHSSEIEKVLGYMHYNVIVHKDNLVVV